MYQTFKVFCLCLLVCGNGAVNAQGLPDNIEVDSETLILNGKGSRTKLFVDLYHAGLYLTSSSNDAESIIDSDSAMAIVLEITSGLITAEKMESAVREGFDNSTGGNIGDITDSIEQFIDVLHSGVSEGDMFKMVYLPGSGVSVSKNSEEQALIPGLPFKKALFGIWLSNSPVQKSLKKSLLGR